MPQDRSGRYTLAYIIFGFIFSLVLIFGTGLYSIAKRVGQAPAGPSVPDFVLTASDFEPFTREVPATGAPIGAAVERGGRLDRPLRLGAPIRGSLVPAALLQAADARLGAGAVRPDGSVEFRRIDARLERYDALAKGEVDLIWDTLGSLAEELPRLQALGLQARVVMPLGSGDPADALVMARPAGPLPARGSFAAVESFSAAHLIALELIANASLTAAERGARHASLLLVGTPRDAYAKAISEASGSAVAVGTGSALEPEGARKSGSAPFLNVEVLVAHPRLLEEGTGSLVALLDRWVRIREATPALSQPLHADVARIFGIEAADVPRLGGPSGVPDAAAQDRFFRGVGAGWTDAASEVWMKLGLLRRSSPAAQWFDGRYLPASQRAEPSQVPGAPQSPLAGP